MAVQHPSSVWLLLGYLRSHHPSPTLHINNRHPVSLAWCARSVCPMPGAAVPNFYAAGLPRPSQPQYRACCLCNSLPIHAHARAAYVPDCAMQAPGMVVHVSAGHHSGTLVNALMHRLGMPAVDLSAAAAAAGAGTGSGKEEDMSDSSSLCCQHTLEVRSEYRTAPLHIPTVLHYCTYPQYCTTAHTHCTAECTYLVLARSLSFLIDCEQEHLLSAVACHL